MKKIALLLSLFLMFSVGVMAEDTSSDMSDEVVDEEIVEEETDIYDEESENVDDFYDGVPEEEENEGEDAENSGGDNNITVPDGITVILNDKIIIFDAAQPKFLGDRVMVPMRKLFESLGADVLWDDESKTAKAAKGELNVEISIGSHIMKMNGAQKEIDAPAQIFYNRTYVPVRFVSEALGAEVSWNDERKTVYLSTEK